MPNIKRTQRTKKKRHREERMRSPWIIFVEKCMERDGVKLSYVVKNDTYREEYFMERA